MAMRAYNELYLNHAAKSFGSMLDYAVNDCEIAGGFFLHMFITSGLAEQFEHGNPKVIAGMSGVELAIQTIETATGAKPTVELFARYYRTPEFWGGWALAHYQWFSTKSFSTILRAFPWDEIVASYYPLHEADITKFYAIAEERYTQANPQTNLRRIRDAAGLTQSQLAEQAEVSLRSIQMYEQRNKDINKAQAITLAKIARVLNCDVEDLLESEE